MKFSAVFIVLALPACGADDERPADKAAAPVQIVDSVPTPTPMPTAAPSPTPSPEAAEAPKIDVEPACEGWADPITGSCWAALPPAPWGDAAAACAAPWSLPGRQALWDARAHGLNDALAAGKGDDRRIAWTNGDVPLGGALVTTVVLNGSDTVADRYATKADVRGVYCIRSLSDE